MFYQAKSFMFYNVQTTCRTFVSKLEILSKTLLDCVTMYSDTLIGIIDIAWHHCPTKSL